ncbi:DUF6545 domain-containing protein [Nocardia pneumoniae]|uniref:DUF6545 domain-containing protein n=1 Tax=Nocardia pneumoniae TaxID=228601 RepID=UPI00030C4F3B|nr:DUF6545 domain-containing protein [Nocardia pneumoniae]
MPLGAWLIETAGLDRNARACRRLRPLWRDLTAAVPEILLLPDTDTLQPTVPATRLRRIAIEIRDASCICGRTSRGNRLARARTGRNGVRPS